MWKPILRLLSWSAVKGVGEVDPVVVRMDEDVSPESE